MLPLLDGIAAAAVHVVSGPDHLAAVAPLAAGARHRRRPLGIGACWGVGHGLGVLLLGLLGQVVLSAGQVAVASEWTEVLVGVVLVALGATTMRRAHGLVVHDHLHAHGTVAHRHLHVHRGRGGEGHHHHHTALGIGLLHGVSGTGQLWGVLPSLSLGAGAAVLYLLAYGAATVVVMALFAAGVGRLSRACGPGALPRVLRLTAVASIAVGVWWVAAGWPAAAGV